MSSGITTITTATTSNHVSYRIGRQWATGAETGPVIAFCVSAYTDELTMEVVEEINTELAKTAAVEGVDFVKYGVDVGAKAFRPKSLEHVALAIINKPAGWGCCSITLRDVIQAHTGNGRMTARMRVYLEENYPFVVQWYAAWELLDSKTRRARVEAGDNNIPCQCI